ncbi:Protein of unknown function [Cotesia congregata]|uniref:Uncharacterized protein n=1 Tax=Cotesia congregata TaxID=51543 RepID=A0A8J2MGI2_COTCN|nr:Protein of unknown function [Cotesia congregata]
MIEKDGYNYWKDDKKRGEDKEQWARIRCGNIERAYKKGYTVMTHCQQSNITNEVKKGVNEEERKFLEKWDKLVEEEEIEKEKYTILRGEIDAKFEELIKRKTEAEKVGEESAEAGQRAE